MYSTHNIREASIQIQPLVSVAATRMRDDSSCPPALTSLWNETRRESKTIPSRFKHCLLDFCYRVSLHTLHFCSIKLWSLSLTHFGIAHNKVLRYRLRSLSSEPCNQSTDRNVIRVRAWILCTGPHDSSGDSWTQMWKLQVLNQLSIAQLHVTHRMLEEQSRFKIYKISLQLRLYYSSSSETVFHSQDHQYKVSKTEGWHTAGLPQEAAASRAHTSAS